MMLPTSLKELMPQAPLEAGFRPTSVLLFHSKLDFGLPPTKGPFQTLPAVEIVLVVGFGLEGVATAFHSGPNGLIDLFPV